MRNVVAVVAVVGIACGWVGGQEVRKEVAGASGREFGRYVEEVPKYFVKIEMVPVKGGKFVMAPIEKEGRPREVEVRDFWMAKTEVTWDSYNAFRFWLDLSPEEQDRLARMGHGKGFRPERPDDNPDRNFGQQGKPVISVTFHAADAYCRWLSAQTGRRYRLPTEAEFEFAARAGRAGDSPARVEAEAWTRETTWSEEFEGGWTQPVGTLAANPWGLHDLLGNVAEWTIPPEGVGVAAARGGSFRSSSKLLTYAYRQPFTEKWQARDAMEPKSRWWLSDGEMIGFRVVRERGE